MSWQDKALAAFWADALANEPLDSHRRIEAAIAAASASLLPSTDAPMADHPITPPPELVQQWRIAPEYASDTEKLTMVSMTTRRLREIATQAARWGADQELEACCGWLKAKEWIHPEFSDELREARRPKPPSLKEQAFNALDTYIYGNPDHNDKEQTYNTIRRALEQLDD